MLLTIQQVLSFNEGVIYLRDYSFLKWGTQLVDLQEHTKKIPNGLKCNVNIIGYQM